MNKPITLPIISIITGLGGWLIIFVIVGWQEELLFRGYHLQTLTSSLNLLLGVIISPSIFGILHTFNYGATVFSIIGIFLAGLFLAPHLSSEGRYGFPLVYSSDGTFLKAWCLDYQ